MDVETVGILGRGAREGIDNAVFNIGIVIANNGNVIYREQVGIMDIFKYPVHLIKDFYRKNFNENDFTMKFGGFDEFSHYFNELLKSFKGKGLLRLWSFNASFDKRAFRQNAELYELEFNQKIFDSWYCIQNLAMWKLSNNPKLAKDYTEFAILTESKLLDYSAISEVLNVRVRAEQVYRFIIKDAYFVEAHKGLQDCEIELQILQWCKKTPKWSQNLNGTKNWSAFNVRRSSGVGHLENLECPIDYGFEYEHIVEFLIQRKYGEGGVK